MSEQISIWTREISEEFKNEFTPFKCYPITFLGPVSGKVINDEGNEIYIDLVDSAYPKDGKWQIANGLWELSSEAQEGLKALLQQRDQQRAEKND